MDTDIEGGHQSSHYVDVYYVVVVRNTVIYYVLFAT